MLRAMASPLDAELERYADLVVALAGVSADRDEVLGQHGFDEEAWEQYDAAWRDRLSANEREADATGQVPPLWVAFSEALQRAQERRTTGLLDVDEYAVVARVLARGGDVPSALQQYGISMFDFLHAHRHWIKKATSDDALAKRLAKLLS